MARHTRYGKAGWFFGSGLFLLTLSLAMIFWIKVDLHAQKQEVIHLEEDLTAHIHTEQKKPRSLNSMSASGLNANPGFTMTQSVENAPALGVVRIDAIGVVLPIYPDASAASLSAGAGVVEGTDIPSSMPGTMSVLAAHRGGHREDQSFLHVNQLQQGDEIKVTTAEAVLYYEVLEQKIIAANDWRPFAKVADRSTLFLLSCHPYPTNKQRIIVHAILKKATEQPIIS